MDSRSDFLDTGSQDAPPPEAQSDMIAALSTSSGSPATTPELNASIGLNIGTDQLAPHDNELLRLSDMVDTITKEDATFEDSELKATFERLVDSLLTDEEPSTVSTTVQRQADPISSHPMRRFRRPTPNHHCHNPPWKLYSRFSSSNSNWSKRQASSNTS